MVTYTTQITQFYLLGIQSDIEGFVGKPRDISIPFPYSLIDNEYLNFIYVTDDTCIAYMYEYILDKCMYEHPGVAALGYP